jgi:hypothetical protein
MYIKKLQKRIKNTSKFNLIELWIFYKIEIK